MNPAKVSPLATNKSCLQCHFGKPAGMVGRIQSGHGRNAVPCTSCHSVHQVKATIPKCESCHAPVMAEFSRPHTHPVKQGTMTCADCHNPHGGPRRNMTRLTSANEPGCFLCHGDRRGPYAFEHPPMRTDGCTACHVPHGTANPRMLIRHEERLVCLECHANLGTARAGGAGGVPPAFHDLRSPRYQSCSMCHVKIHGSHVSRSLLR